MAEFKMTRKMYFELLKDTVKEEFDAFQVDEHEVSAAEVVDFIDKEIAKIEKKAESAKDRAAEKKAEGDQLREDIKSVLTDEFMSVDEITALVIEATEVDGVTRSKIVPRLSALAKLGIAEKGKKDRTVAYKLAE